MSTSQPTDIGFEILPSSHPLPDAEREQVMAAPGFGQVFTDHMATIRWSDDKGWHDAAVVPYSNIAAMYQQMGQGTNATKYAKLAKSIDTSDSTDQPQQQRIGRSQPTGQTKQNRSR